MHVVSVFVVTRRCLEAFVCLIGGPTISVIEKPITTYYPSIQKSSVIEYYMIFFI
jgi:hypothetical protein